MEVTPAEFADLADLVCRRSGIVLTPDKATLIGNRLKPVAQRFGFRDVAALLSELPYPSEELARAVAEAMTTNETSFFRHQAAFDFLARTAIPSLARARNRRIRIWCAAASTGQEAYSLAIIIDAAGFGARGWKIDLIATDLSETAIARAADGRYAQCEVERGLPPEMRDRYFVREGCRWRVVDRLRRMIIFRPFNLLDHFGWLGEIDIVLCRNVLLYFDPRTKAEIQTKLADVLADDGYLLLGENEIASGHFVPASRARAVYMKVPMGVLRRVAVQ